MKNNLRRFGTLEGVFLPTILARFGVILFLRTGWVVGNAGLINAFLMLTLAASISFLTSRSISSISTNAKMGSGGIYYLISRSMGLEIGGSIGISLYLAQATSVAFYIIGFLESFKILFPHVNVPLWGSVILIIFTVLAYYGADLALKFQYGIFGILILGILSVVFSHALVPLKDNLTPHNMGGYDFFKVFAVFFPAFKGISTGVGLSGELKDPSKSIPKGLVSALLFSILVYALFMIKASAIAHYESLIKDPVIFIRNAVSPILVLLGIWAATLSSVLAYIVTAPRTLKALSDDRIVPQFCSLTLGSPKNEPRMALFITFLITEGFILVGSLNRVASIITIFFLITQGMINITTFVEIITGNPSFRPRLKVPFYLPLLGAFGTFSLMFFISIPGAIISILFVSLTYVILKHRSLKQDWGDLRAGLLISISRYALLLLQRFNLDPKNYRPNIMVFDERPDLRPYLAKFANYLARGNGIVTFIGILEGDASLPEDVEKKNKSLSLLKKFVEENKLVAFYEVELVENPSQSILCVVQAHGIGNLYSNVALFGWNYEKHRENITLKHLRELFNLGKDTLILDYKENKGFGDFSRIDVWWGGKGGNIELMLLLSYILKLNDDWRKAKVRVIKVVDTEGRRKIAERNIQQKLIDARLEASVKVIINDIKEPVSEIIKRESKNASLVILGLPVPKRGTDEDLKEKVNNLISGLPTTLLVRAVSGKGVFE